MALIQCRECGKMVSEEADICPYCGAKMPSHKRKQRRRYITIVIILLILGSIAWAYHKVSQAFSSPPATTTTNAAPSKIQKDIPVKDQIIQKSDKEIIKEMLDSGESVSAISKKTGIRRDEIKKIKKEKELEDKAK